MHRLATFGCSLTFGEGLSDAQVDKKNPSKAITEPSQYSWPSVLAKKLNYSLENFAKCGISNKQICQNILESDLSKIDTVFILWTHFPRHCIFTSKTHSPIRLNPTNHYGWKGMRVLEVKKIRNYYKNYFTHYNSFIESFHYINLAKLYLDKLDIESHHFLIEDVPYYSHEHDEYYDFPEWNKVKINLVNFDYIDYALDNDHPGPKSHENMADRILKIIKA